MVLPKSLDFEIKSDLNITHNITDEDIYDWLTLLDTEHQEGMIEELKYILEITNIEYQEFINTLKRLLNFYCEKYHYCDYCYEKMLSREFLEKHTDIDCHERLQEWYCINCD